MGHPALKVPCSWKFEYNLMQILLYFTFVKKKKNLRTSNTALRADLHICQIIKISLGFCYEPDNKNQQNKLHQTYLY